MKLEYYGHSCFRMTFASGTRIVTDPYGDVGFPMPHTEADIVTVSHGHYDHCNVAAVGGAPAVLSAPVSCEKGGVKISAIPCFHDDAHGAKRGKNLIFRFRAEGLDVCHLGDLGERANERIIEALRGADVLLIPVGGHYTIDAMEAKEYVSRISPKLVIPMHLRCGGTVDLTGDFVASQSQKIIFMERI